MTSGAQQSSSEEKSIECPGKWQEESPDQKPLCLPYQPSPCTISPCAEAQSQFLEASQPRVARLSPLSLRGMELQAALTELTPKAPVAWKPVLPKVFLGDPGEPLDHPRVLPFLKVVLDREARLWRGGRLQDEICDAFRGVVEQLLRLQNIFLFAPCTFNLAFTILNQLLVSVKIRKRILHCVTITSLRLAAKLNEEDEVIPRVRDFLKHYGCEYTPGELRRMELTILDKLNWDIHFGTPLNFLNIFHALVVLDWPHVRELIPQRNPSLHIASLTRQLQHCMADHQLLQVKGSTIALVIITLELERLMPDCWTLISDLLKKAQILGVYTGNVDLSSKMSLKSEKRKRRPS